MFLFGIVLGFILGILFTYWGASEDVAQWLKESSKSFKENNANKTETKVSNELKYESHKAPNGRWYINCPTCCTKLSLNAIRCVVCGTEL